MYDRIIIVPNQMSGEPCIRNLRIPIATIFLLISLFLSISANANNNEIDSLLNRCNEVAGIDKINTLINISRQYFILEDTIALTYARKAIHISDSMKYDQGKGQAQLFLGLTYNYFNEDSAIKYYILSSDILTKIKHPWAGFGYENTANKYVLRGWFPEALEYAIKAGENYALHGDSLQLSLIQVQIGHIYIRLKMYDKAYEHFEKAKKLIFQKNMLEREGNIAGNIGIMFDEQGIFDSALYYNLKAVDYFTKANSLYNKSQWQGNIGNTYLKMGNYDMALQYLDDAINGSMYDDNKAVVFNNFAKIYIEKHEYNKAFEMLDSAYAYGSIFKQNVFLSETWYRYFEIYKEQGNMAEALRYFQKYTMLEDSMLNVKKTEEIAQMRVRYETEEKEKELLIEKAEKIKAELKVNSRNKWIMGISFFALSVVLFVLFVMQRNKRKAQQEKDKAIITEQEKGLVAVFNAQEEERSRVAKDLHDGIGQQISAVNLNFQALAKKIVSISDDFKPDIDKIKKMIADTGTDVRSISHQMMPRALTKFGLIDALEDMIDSSFANSKIECEFEHFNMDKRLPQNIEIGLYRIAQELINNIFRHSKAGKVNIELVKKENHCILIVQDDGKGIDDKNTDGIGIRNMNSRLRAMNGELNLESDSHSGTTAIVKIRL